MYNRSIRLSIMTYEKARLEALKVPWKVEPCGQGDDCWCRLISPVTPIPYIYNGEGEMFDCIVHFGAIDKTTAEYLVTLHNGSLESLGLIKKEL